MKLLHLTICIALNLSYLHQAKALNLGPISKFTEGFGQSVGKAAEDLVTKPARNIVKESTGLADKERADKARAELNTLNSQLVVKESELAAQNLALNDSIAAYNVEKTKYLASNQVQIESLTKILIEMQVAQKSLQEIQALGEDMNLSQKKYYNTLSVLMSTIGEYQESISVSELSPLLTSEAKAAGQLWFAALSVKENNEDNLTSYIDELHGVVVENFVEEYQVQVQQMENVLRVFQEDVRSKDQKQVESTMQSTQKVAETQKQDMLQLTNVAKQTIQNLKNTNIPEIAL